MLINIHVRYTCMYISLKISLAHFPFHIYFVNKICKQGFSVYRKKCAIFLKDVAPSCIQFYRKIKFVTFLWRWLSVWVVATDVGKRSRTDWPNANIVFIDPVLGRRTLLSATSLYFFTDGSHVYCYNSAQYDCYYHDTKRAYGLSRRPVVLASLGRVFGAVLGFYHRLRVVVYRHLLPWCSSSWVFI